jgi:hypothetical protein
LQLDNDESLESVPAYCTVLYPHHLIMSVTFAPETASLVRVYAGVAQRVKPCYLELNTHASFVLYSDRHARSCVWQGQAPNPRDCEHAEILAKELRREMPDPLGDIFVVTQGNELEWSQRHPKASRAKDRPGKGKDSSNQDPFALLLQILWMSKDYYFSDKFAAAVSKPLNNASRTVLKFKVFHTANDAHRGGGVVLEHAAENSYLTGQSATVNNIHVEIGEVIYHAPDRNNHSIPKLKFSQLYSSSSIFTVETSNQWDVWIGDQVDDDVYEAVLTLVHQLAREKNTLGHKNGRHSPDSHDPEAHAASKQHAHTAHAAHSAAHTAHTAHADTFSPASIAHPAAAHAASPRLPSTVRVNSPFGGENAPIFGANVRTVCQFYERAVFRANFLQDWKLGSQIELHEVTIIVVLVQ